MPIIEVDRLTKHYGKRVAVENVSFSLEPGDTQAHTGTHPFGSCDDTGNFGVIGDAAQGQLAGVIRVYDENGSGFDAP